MATAVPWEFLIWPDLIPAAAFSTCKCIYPNMKLYILPRPTCFRSAYMFLSSRFLFLMQWDNNSHHFLIKLSYQVDLSHLAHLKGRYTFIHFPLLLSTLFHLVSAKGTIIFCERRSASLMIWRYFLHIRWLIWNIDNFHMYIFYLQSLSILLIYYAVKVKSPDKPHPYFFHT